MADSAQEQVAIVTGGGSGIGAALCRELARQGAGVVVAANTGADASQVATAIVADGGRATAACVDVSREQDVTFLVQETASAYSRLDYLFNNAGIAIGGDARDLTLDHWRRVLDVDLYGVVHGMLAAYPIMATQGFGHIVNTSSAAAFLPDPGDAPYCTAKHAIVGLSLSLRLEGADLGVKVSVVCPGVVRTSIFDNVVVVNVPRDKAVRPPAKMIEAAQAAQAILAGVARNKAVIVFPASARWVRRAYQLMPGAFDRYYFLPRLRDLRRYRAAASGK